MAEEKIVTAAPEAEEQDINELKRIRIEKLEALQAAGNDPFEITLADQSIHNAEIVERFEELENQDVSICGRMMSRRDMGKANFIDVRDLTGRMQVYVKIDEIGEDVFAEFKKWDIGDIVEVKGFVFRTRRGEISVHAKEIRLHSKSLLPLPEKFHGLTNTDTRYRRRYLDLIMNPEVKDTFVKRSLILREIRNYLDSQGFLEVETPILVANAGGAAARPFLSTRISSSAFLLSSTSRDSSSAVWKRFTKSAEFSETKAVTPVTTPNSLLWSSIRHTPITTA